MRASAPNSTTPRILQWRADNRAARLQTSGCSERRILPDPNRVGEELLLGFRRVRFELRFRDIVRGPPETAL
jgi:hypothetical protein